MKLILSSCDFRNEKSQKVIMGNLPYPINKCRLLFIPNEKATKGAISGDVYYDRMQEFGFAKENVYVEAPSFCDGVLYFIMVDFAERTLQIVAFNTEDFEQKTVFELPLDNSDISTVVPGNVVDIFTPSFHLTVI